jgi:hypothetical protein
MDLTPLSAHEVLRARFLMAYAATLTPEETAQRVPLLFAMGLYLERGWHDYARDLLRLYDDI